MLVSYTSAGYGHKCTQCPNDATWGLLQAFCIMVGIGSVYELGSCLLINSQFLLCCSFMMCFVGITTNEAKLRNNTPQLSILCVFVSFFQVTVTRHCVPV